MVGAMGHGLFDMLTGFPLYPDPNLRRRVPVMCRSRKKRQVKKWLKDPRHYRSIIDTVNLYRIQTPQGPGFVGHPDLIEKIKKAATPKASA